MDEMLTKIILAKPVLRHYRNCVSGKLAEHGLIKHPYCKQELEHKIGKHVDADLLALRLAEPATRPVSEAGGEDLLDDFCRRLGDGLVLIACSTASKLACEIWTATEGHGQASQSF
jgi:hypothetical protein